MEFINVIGRYYIVITEDLYVLDSVRQHNISESKTAAVEHKPCLSSPPMLAHYLHPTLSLLAASQLITAHCKI